MDALAQRYGIAPSAVLAEPAGLVLAMLRVVSGHQEAEKAPVPAGPALAHRELLRMQTVRLNG